jgi:hypothetical protein
MNPLFTVHAGEYLVGSHMETHYKKWNVWVALLALDSSRPDC